MSGLYPPGCSGTPYDDEGPSQALAKALQTEKCLYGIGRKQHGLNGKDADLDNGGQCVIDAITVLDPPRSKVMKLEIQFHCYANICHPTSEKEDDAEYAKEQEQIMDLATEIVCGATEYEGEWTGSDYWCFSSGPVTVQADLTVDEYDEYDDTESEELLVKLAQRCLDAINNDELRRCRSFERFAADLNRQMDELGQDFRKEAQ